MIEPIKNYLLKRCIEKHKFFRQKKIVSLEQTKSMGIICQITNEDSYKEVYDMFSKMHSPKRSVWLMGYVDAKEVPYYCLQQLSADFFSKKNLNWYGKPDFVQLHDFMDKDFDILIDFSRKELSPLRYILTISKAKLIVGANESMQDLYDVYIKDEADLTNLNLLKTIHNYLLKLTGG